MRYVLKQNVSHCLYLNLKDMSFIIFDHLHILFTKKFMKIDENDCYKKLVYCGKFFELKCIGKVNKHLPHYGNNIAQKQQHRNINILLTNLLLINGVHIFVYVYCQEMCVFLRTFSTIFSL